MVFDIVVDIETLGTDPNKSPIIQIAAVVVADTSINDNLRYDMCSEELDFKNVSERTLKWWLEENSLLLSDILRRGRGNTEKMVVTGFVEFLTFIQGMGEVHLWGKGPEFDNAFLKAKCEKYGLKWPLSFRQDRCIRTVEQFHYELGLEELPFEGYKHDAISDAVDEARMLVQVRKELRKHEADLTDM